MPDVHNRRIIALLERHSKVPSREEMLERYIKLFAGKIPGETSLLDGQRWAEKGASSPSSDAFPKEEPEGGPLAQEGPLPEPEPQDTAGENGGVTESLAFDSEAGGEALNSPEGGPRETVEMAALEDEGEEEEAEEDGPGPEEEGPNAIKEAPKRPPRRRKRKKRRGLHS